MRCRSIFGRFAGAVNKVQAAASKAQDGEVVWWRAAPPRGGVTPPPEGAV